jgi:ubiquitin carboxyl-terminal hydrolase 8
LDQRWSQTLGGKKLAISEKRGGRVGLTNLGNTCFMNAGLQCLSHIEPVCAYFLTGKYQQELNEKNSFGTGGYLAKAFAKLQEQLWQKSSKTHSPKPLHSTLGRFAPHLFDGYQQQDAQEFLAYLLDGLHEDLNLVKERPPPKIYRNEDEELQADEEQRELELKMGEEYVAAMAWMTHLARHRSILVDLFQGQLRSQVTCTVCDKVSKTFDPYLYMSLPVNADMRSLEDALQLFLAEEVLSGNEQWRCNRCKQRVNARKKIDIWKLPPVLIIHLKRFEFDTRSCRFRKIQAELKSPLTIDLSNWVQGEQKETLVYEMQCVANHSGAFGSGHYTAMCRHPIDGKWYHFNDDKVDEVLDEDKVFTAKAYVLFFMRRGAEDGATEIWRQTLSHPEAWPHQVSKHNSVMYPAVQNLIGKSGNKKSFGKSGKSALASLMGRRPPSAPAPAPDFDEALSLDEKESDGDEIQL